MSVPPTPRAPTGIEGLDAMLGGGLPRGSVTLLRGGPGAGKTTLAMQFLMAGLAHGEKGLYLSLEESADEIVANAARHGWAVDKAIAERRLTIHVFALTRAKDYLKTQGASESWVLSIESGPANAGYAGEFRADALGALAERLVREMDAKRLVFDSVTMFTSQFERRVDLHMETLDLVRSLMKSGCTTLMTAHTDPQGTHVISPEEYLAHGVINLHFLNAGAKAVQAIQIHKMRGIGHDREMRPYRLGDHGLTVYPGETVLGGL
jgi:KaiC/GvpD/RAD55 family RecA-like ATPase